MHVQAAACAVNVEWLKGRNNGRSPQILIRDSNEEDQEVHGG